MKVKELIGKLKKMNPDAEVVIQDHDHSQDEMAGPVASVTASDSAVLIDRMGGPVVTLT
ncbi:hypothetical protein [Pseudomonas frederiksbergensis]|uniref:hypothetical protein n=1 Tax=Pseudomonas frederiksbergensis TaxID=104087 RepID=UPI0013747CFC|nr:hypothetical protein [Pseudomonas frederiksbergensis]